MVNLLFDDPVGMDIKSSSSNGNSQILTTVCLRDAEKFRAYFIYGELADSLAINPCEGVYYLHRPLKDGYEAQLGIEREIGKINRGIREVSELLKIGDLFQMAESSNPQVETYSILCGDKGIIVILINHDYGGKLIYILLLLPFQLIKASPDAFISQLKTLNLCPQNAYLGDVVKVRVHARDFLKYPILLDNKPIGYMLCRTNGDIEEFSLSPFPAKSLVSVKSFPRYKYFLNSHATVCGMLLDHLGLRGNENEKSFVASINLFIEKCICNQQGQPLIYDIAKGLQDFATYKKRKLLIRGARQRAKERREADTFLGVGQLIMGKETYLVLWDAKMDNFLAKNWNGSHTNIIVTEVSLGKW
ncbi:hypothetical protein H5T88_05210 [bacterium]|nr:hypothetical protein [bacterium]